MSSILQRLAQEASSWISGRLQQPQGRRARRAQMRGDLDHLEVCKLLVGKGRGKPKWQIASVDRHTNAKNSFSTSSPGCNRNQILQSPQSKYRKSGERYGLLDL